MGAAYFYHLTEDSLEHALPILLGKALEAGWRVEVRGTDPDRLARLDVELWKGAGPSFLPHGIAGGPHDADQPILLTTAVNNTNNASCIVSVHGAVLSSEEVKTADRAMVVFDGHDGTSVQIARDAWKQLTGAGTTAQYWAQEGGRWVKKAETA
ncbi:DNA polymerase III subunit chi [Marivivens niveibacter]|uniref:DNA polymerase III subunit chi n=1 Tax=Marivivens niveibacter TaxID=1930667 RepID=A0A251X238_9RHOB|nr:DNA polymerase III subunit chi [Marivivens niveibacter]OUD10780.1 DNA polymerase III subunit chi [Marivivens niveibacter]